MQGGGIEYNTCSMQIVEGNCCEFGNWNLRKPMIVL